MKKKWSSDKVRSIQKWLVERWPELFTPAPDMKPLSLDIYKDILEFRNENPNLSARVLREALKRHTSSFGYLYGMLKYSHRYNLSGEQADVIDSGHREWAKNTLKVKQRIAQKVRKKRGQQGSIPRTGSRDLRLRPLSNGSKLIASRSERKAPVIKYKQPKRRQVDPSRTLDLLAG